jgi:hypothetical protein
MTLTLTFDSIFYPGIKKLRSEIDSRYQYYIEMGYLLVLITLKLIGEDILFYPFHGGHLGFFTSAILDSSQPPEFPNVATPATKLRLFYRPTLV